ncbi:hypothetical protein M011DRAFT_464708 [Sporormia fimetaria CBS 119925]|uniref:Uncharacterized protein n=1 Tax=Sporormia fimetaria CBS 119925 TaxID=1340428 RepID=A0A6A6VM64_9PLEO|nr:hypothetical protein M011DRAFT_464708 [Sporormia fimetaria CBS 119925]
MAPQQKTLPQKKKAPVPQAKRLPQQKAPQTKRIPQTKPLPQKKAPAPAPQQKSWLAKTANAATTGISNFAGGIITAAGNGVAGAGKGAADSVANTTASWGSMVRDYGNSIKDATGARGSRAATATNPLGLSGTSAGAKTAFRGRPGNASYGKGSASNPLGL